MPTGEISSDGSSLTFARDSQSRITAITDPMGKSLTYQYDFYGDLVSVTDRDGNVTRFTYDTDHLLSRSTIRLAERVADRIRLIAAG